MDELQNPYRPGAGTQPPALLGRDELLDRFTTAVRRAKASQPGKGVMPVGLRGVGKTVLLNRFTQIAAEEGMSVAFVEAPETGEFTTQLVNRLRRALLALDNERTSAKIRIHSGPHLTRARSRSKQVLGAPREDAGRLID